MATVNPSINSHNSYTVIARHKMDWNAFTDTNHLYQSFGQNAFIDHFGLVTPFNQYGLVNTPIQDFLNQKKATIYLDNLEGKFRFKQPFKRGYPFIKHTEHTDAINQPGRAGAPFLIALSEPYSPGDVINTDLRDAPALVVTETSVKQDGDAWIHEVKISSQNPKHTYYPKKYLKPGSQFIKVDQAIDEYSEQGTAIDSMRLGWIELEANLGSGEKRAEHWVTLHGALLSLSAEDKLKGTVKDCNLKDIGSILAFYNKDIRTKKTIPGSGGWLAAIDAAVLGETYNVREMANTWGQGGEVSVSGRKSIKLSLGVYPQLRTGNRITYNLKKGLNLGLIDSGVANLYRGSGIKVEDRVTYFDCGSGFLNEISKLLELKIISKTPGIINADQLGMISGKDPMNLTGGYRFTSWRFPNAGLVYVRHSAALDNEYGLRNTDGFFGQFPKHSYSAMILDITDARSSNVAQKFRKEDARNATSINDDTNVYMVKPRQADGDFWGYVAGTVNPFNPRQTKGFVGGSFRNGYGIYAYNFGNVWIKDPSRTLLIEVE